MVSKLVEKINSEGTFILKEKNISHDALGEYINLAEMIHFSDLGAYTQNVYKDGDNLYLVRCNKDLSAKSLYVYETK